MSSKEYILVTGGAGYIGSHTVIELINNGYDVIIVDNLCNSNYDSVARVEYIVKRPVKFYDVDLRDTSKLSEVFSSHKIKGVIHFAALKAVGESTKIPLEYYDNNVTGTISLLTVMKNHGVKTIVFSSSATVYGDATRFENMIPIPEHCPNDPTNPYGKTKYMIENIIKDIHGSDNSWRAAILRYFNPIGAHPSGLIGEDPLGIPNNLLPFLAQVAIGKREKLFVFGNDYNSHDGTPIRDYIHVVDLAKGHIAALNYLRNLNEKDGLYREWNLGTGKGSTVFDVYNAFCKAVGKKLPFEVAGRRDGDVLDLTANPTRANSELKWKAELSIDEACKDLWKWTTENPSGFRIENYQWKLFNDSEKVDYDSRLHTVRMKDLEVSFANYGALIQCIRYKNKALINCFCGIEKYKSPSNPLFGSTVGRYANRISNGEISLGGQTFKLDKNENNKNTLHGGTNGFHRQMFLGPVVKGHESCITVEFTLLDKDGNGGFPADLVTTVKYTVRSNSIDIEYESFIDENSQVDETAVNLTNHTYWNLGEEKAIDGTYLKTATNEYLEVDSDSLLPTGSIAEYPKDLTKGITLTNDIKLDNCFVVSKNIQSIDTREEPLKQIAELSNPNTKIHLRVKTTEPSFQIYTSDQTNIPPFGSRSGISFEPCRFIDAINSKEFANQVTLKKGSVYGSKTSFEIL
ncbi:Piso0_002825 [Millerozyma farinosa CBS 7064]|uniref:Piso0_002825 protein n=1 Tax=Pichia sorbitophila (strain ATCC MYA-4447 / BCRC 22081 / CBS 7064 / NBRC 10061 / NRRL Y-12695) TaxID=559304 RepID=G8YG29_PICSO|nr:Piso0_002825 [Millerozyma farinosa CBS 7064]